MPQNRPDGRESRCDEERIDILENMVLLLYEDMVPGRISEANLNLLIEKTQKEQAELKARVEEGRKKLADEIRLAYDARQWVEAIQEHADITELDSATLNRLIKEIVVHERIDSDKTRHISMLKTFAGKYRTQISRIIRKSRQEKHFLVEYPKKNGQVGKVLFYNNEFRRGTKVESGNPDVIARVFENYGRNIISWAKMYDTASMEAKK